MSATLTAAAVYLAMGANTLDREKFKAGSQPYQPSRIVSCPLNEYGRPSGCRVDTVGRFANPSAAKSGYAVAPVPQSVAFDSAK